MSKYTPTTDEVRETYERARYHLDDMPEEGDSYRAGGGEFDRWLAAHDSMVRRAHGEQIADSIRRISIDQALDPHTLACVEVMREDAALVARLEDDTMRAVAADIDLDATDIRPDSRTMIWPRVGSHDGLEITQDSWDRDAAHVDVTLTPCEMRTVASWLLAMAREGES